MEKYIGKNIKINLEKGLDFNYNDASIKIYQIYKDNGTIGGMVSEGVTIEEKSWIKEGGMVVSMIGGGRVHISGNSNIKGVVTLFADEIYLDNVFMKNRECRIASESNDEGREFGKVRIKNLTMYEGSEIRLFIDTSESMIINRDIDMDRVRLGDKAILNLQNYGSVRNLDVHYSSVLNARVSSKFSISNMEIGDNGYISFSGIGTLFISDFMVIRGNIVRSNHVTFANQDGESDLIISNCSVDSYSFSKSLVEECEIYERVKWESRTT